MSQRWRDLNKRSHRSIVRLRTRGKLSADTRMIPEVVQYMLTAYAKKVDVLREMVDY